MDTKDRIEILKDRLNKLVANDKENIGAQRRIRREIRNLEKTLQEPQPVSAYAETTGE
ncbi:MAG: hypothetical protein LUH00_02330 [Lachnospiraceae bacterium]|nr:hypothetical protein [Lachnospiraceae bacterium]